MSTAMDNPSWQELLTRGSAGGCRIVCRVLRRRGEPFLILPSNTRNALTALSLYPAQTPKARALRSLVKTALRCHLPVGVEKAEVSLDDQSPFARFLKEQAGTQTFPSLGLLAGNARTPGRRFIVLLFGEQNTPPRVVKVGMNTRANELIQREESFLRSVTLTGGGIPRVLGAFQDHDRSAFAMEFVDGDSPTPTAEGIADLVNTWVQEKPAVRLGDTAPWRELETTLEQTPWAALGRELRERRVAAVIGHGDLAPWNIKVSRTTGRMQVLDWERGTLAGVPGWDWFHFVVQSGMLVQKQTAPELRAGLERVLESQTFAGYAARTGIAGNRRPLALAYVLYNLNVLRPSEGAETLRGLVEELTRSWKSDLKS